MRAPFHDHQPDRRYPRKGLVNAASRRNLRRDGDHGTDLSHERLRESASVVAFQSRQLRGHAVAPGCVPYLARAKDPRRVP